MSSATSGVAWDIIEQAINTYDSWMLDDDYDASRVLREIIEQMRTRRSQVIPSTHDWFVPDFIGYECCRKCGIIRRPEREHTPCRGVVKIGLRTEDKAKT